MPLKFRNPQNDYLRTIDNCGLWCLLFGGFYFAYMGVWKHFILYALAFCLTGPICWVVYPFFARGIVKEHFLMQGWRDAVVY